MPRSKNASQVSVGEDDYQTTVGASRSKWAKELVDDAKMAISAMNSIKEVEQTEEKEKIPDKKESSESGHECTVCPSHPCLPSSSYQHEFSAGRTEANGSDEKCMCCYRLAFASLTAFSLSLCPSWLWVGGLLTS